MKENYIVWKMRKIVFENIVNYTIVELKLTNVI